MKTQLLSLCLSFSLMAGASNAAALWTFDETGGDVVGTLSGSIDLTGMVYDRSGFTETSIFPSAGSILSGGPATDVYIGTITGPSTYGSGLKTLGTGTGSVFGFLQNLDLVVVESGYSSNDALSGTLTFSGTDFATMGIVQGLYQFSLPNDTITVRFGDVSQVPLPAGGVLLLSALAGLALRFRRA